MNQLQRVANILKNKRGAALMMALFTVVLIVFLAVEVSYETAVEYRVATADYQRLKAYYAAKAGVELSLLRIQLYKKVAKQYKEQLKGATQMLDLIWQFPFVWPPQISKDMGRVSAEELKESVSQSLMDSTYLTQISGESGRLDLNDLASPSKALQDATRKQLLQLIENRLAQDDEWAKNNQDLKAEEIINDIQDWVDADQESRNGGAEDARYPDANSTFVPPNRPFKTMQELHMVRGMSDELFDVISPSVTVYGLKGINVNYASEAVLKSIDPQITEEIAKEILKRRDDPNYGPFANEQDFQGFLSSQGVNLGRFNESQIPLYFDTEYNFKIQSIGQFGNSTREIVAVVYDFDTVKTRLEKLIATSNSADGVNNPADTTSAGGTLSAAGTLTPNDSTQEQSQSSGPPRVIYWYED